MNINGCEVCRSSLEENSLFPIYQTGTSCIHDTVHNKTSKILYVMTFIFSNIYSDSVTRYTFTHL